MPEAYTVHINNEVFTLTKDQVEFDSPNYFTSCFLGDFAESQSHVLYLSRDPDLFRIIIEYLSGYEVLPLNNSVIPRRMNRESVLRNLRVDADFYLLDGLVAQITNAQSAQPAQSPGTSALSSYVLMSGNVSLWDLRVPDFTDLLKLTSWGAPAYISAKLATELQTKHGISAEFHLGWSEYLPEIQRALRIAGITRQFMVEASWQEIHPRIRSITNSVVLNIV